MKVREKLFFMSLAVILLAYATHELVSHLRAEPPSPRQIGLEWLRQEYKLSDEAHEKIMALHQEYFIRCNEMCETMKRAHRPQLARGRFVQSAQARAEAQKREKAVCENCLENMVQHLTTVAALMTPVEGERFLKDILPEVINPPQLQKLRRELTPLQ